MPPLTPAALRRQIAAGSLAPVYLLLGEDDTEKLALAGELTNVVEEDLRPFNVERMYGRDARIDAVIDAARTLPMMAPRRIIVVLEAEKLLMTKRGAKGEHEDSEQPATAKQGSKGRDEGTASLEAFLQDPPPHSTVVFVSGPLDGRRRITTALHAHAQVVTCGSIESEADAERWVRTRAAQESLTLEPAAVRALVTRTGLDIVRLRAGLERVALYALGQPAITAQDVETVIPPAPDAQEDFGIANAIGRGDVRGALKELGLALDGGAVPFFLMGQIRIAAEKLPAPRLREGIDALFRTDLALKSSGGDPRILLERLVVELCGSTRGAAAARPGRPPYRRR